MPNFSGFSVKHNDITYHLDLSWDEGRFMEGEIAFGAKVGVQPDGSDITTVSEAGIAVIEEEGEPILQITVNDEEVFREKLNDIIGEENVVDAIPSILFGEPITGCLLRAGISASVSQILHCKDITSGVEWFWPRSRVIGRCLVENGVKMTGRVLLKAGICMSTV